MNQHLPDEGIYIPKIELGVYRHYKGNHYDVLGIGLNTEDHTPLVIYKPIGESKIPFWVRPYDMFIEKVTVDGKVMPRFKRLDE